MSYGKAVEIHQTGEYFDTIIEASEALGISTKTFDKYIHGHEVPEWFLELQIITYWKSEKCVICGIELNEDNKVKFKSGNLKCKKCHQYVKKLKTYKMSGQELSFMYKNQNGCCAICGTHEDLNTRRLSVDHNHNTGKIRGLLCARCNVGLGMLQADSGIDLLCSAISYLRNMDNIN